MDRKDFLKILQNPAHITNEQMFELEKIIQENPYFQAAKVLYLKVLKDQNSFRYNQDLKTTAIYTTDRSVLFDFITSDIFHNPIAEAEEKKIIEEIELRDERIINELNNPDNDDAELLEFDLPKINSPEPTEENLPVDQANLAFEETDEAFKNFEKEMDEHLSILLSNEDAVNEPEDLNIATEEHTESAISIEVEDTPTDDATDNPIFIKDTIETATDSTDSTEKQTDTAEKDLEEQPEHSIATSQNDTEDEENEEEGKEVTSETPSLSHPEIADIQETDHQSDPVIDKAFSLTDLVDESMPAEDTYPKPVKKKNKPLPSLDVNQAVNMDTPDEMYKMILNNPELYKEESNTTEFPSQKEESSYQSNSFVFEIATDEEVLDIDPNIQVSSQETAISNKDIAEILFEPIQEEPDVEKEVPLLDLDIQKPKKFDKNESHSFAEWMQLSSFKPIDRSKEPPSEDEKDEKMALIDEFMTKNPKIKPDKTTAFSVDFNAVEPFDGKTIMTETLAQVYKEQHKYDSAIKAYEILSLKFPEKSSFFADQISALKKLKRGNSSE